MQSITQRFANPTRFMALSSWLLPIFSGLAALTILAGLYLAFFVAPVDYQQGHTVKIMFIHVPSAWLAMMICADCTIEFRLPGVSAPAG